MKIGITPGDPYIDSWNALSTEAKGIIEWVENPFSGRQEDVSIKIGESFRRFGAVHILVTQELYREIHQFILVHKNEFQINLCLDDSLIFMLKKQLPV